MRATCQGSLDNHMRGKGHLRRELLVQEKMKENIGEELKSNNWGMAGLSNNERREYLKLKKNLACL